MKVSSYGSLGLLLLLLGSVGAYSNRGGSYVANVNIWYKNEWFLFFLGLVIAGVYFLWKAIANRWFRSVGHTQQMQPGIQVGANNTKVNARHGVIEEYLQVILLCLVLYVAIRGATVSLVYAGHLNVGGLFPLATMALVIGATIMQLVLLLPTFVAVPDAQHSRVSFWVSIITWILANFLMSAVAWIFTSGSLSMAIFYLGQVATVVLLIRSIYFFRLAIRASRLSQ